MKRRLLGPITVGAAALCAGGVARADIGPPLLVVTGDFDGDGLIDRVQGFPNASDSAGRVDVFWGDPTHNAAWPTVLSAVKDPTTLLGAGKLGKALAVGDFNADGFDDLAVGAPTTKYLGGFAAAEAGTVTVLYGCGNPACGSVDTDGAGVPAVGSSLDPSAGAGAQLIWRTPVGVRPPPFARFGKAIAAGDFDNDGFDDLAIAAPWETVGSDLRAGTVTIVYGSSAGLDTSTRSVLEQDLLPSGASPAEPYDTFGAAIVAARLDPDGAYDLAVGVPGEDYGSLSDVGEVDVFWGATGAGLDPTRYDRFRHTNSMVGGGKDGDRLGARLTADNSPAVPGSAGGGGGPAGGGLAGGGLVSALDGHLVVGFDEASNCGDDRGYLTVAASQIGVTGPRATLSCDPNLCDGSSVIGDGALPIIPVNFIVIANSQTVASANTEVPNANWTGVDPITGEGIGAEQYFTAMIDLLNQQVRGDDGGPVCSGQDCLRFAYRSHTFYSSGMFDDAAGVMACPKLHAISAPANNTFGVPASRFASNCSDDGIPLCPSDGVGGRYKDFSAFAEAAIDECTQLVDSTALNIVIYDLCEHVFGSPTLVCDTERGGRGRQNGHVPYALVDYGRTLRARALNVGRPKAAEEHEVGHAFGLGHVEVTPINGTETPTMQTDTDGSGDLGDRNLGFSTDLIDEVPNADGEIDSVIQTEVLVETARAHSDAWLCP